MHYSNKINILVLCDDRWHPAKTVRAGLAPIEDAEDGEAEGGRGNEMRFDWIENARDWSGESMSAYDVVILSKSNNVSSTDESPWMTEAVEQAFVDYVRQGKGLLAIHSGTAGYKQARAMRALLGGVFDHHPEQCAVTVGAVEPSTPGPFPHKGGRGGREEDGSRQAFTCKDEHYFMEMEGSDANVFLKASSQHGEQPAGWTRQEGSGRVCVLTPGHNVEVWLEPTFQSLLRAAIYWCAGKEGG